MDKLKNKYLTCKDCRREFVHTIVDQRKFKQNGWQDPIRRRYCRRQKKILNMALKDNLSIGNEIKFSEICDTCGRQFYTKFQRKEGENLNCDDCWAEVKYGKKRRVGQGQGNFKN